MSNWEVVTLGSEAPAYSWDVPFVRVAGILVEDHELCVGRHRNRITYETLGGQAEIGEDLLVALQRELFEEAQIKIDLADVKPFGKYLDRSDGSDRPMLMIAYLIGAYEGIIARDREVAHIARINSSSSLPRGSTLEREIIPELLRSGRIH